MLNNNHRILIVLGLSILLALVVWWFRGDMFRKTARNSYSTRQFQTLQLGDQTLEVVLSTTPDQLQQGLSDRATLGAEGMLFRLPTKSIPTFWMYRMLFDLDFIWIADGQVVDMQEKIPAPVPGSSPQEIVQVKPKIESEYVLEVPAGFIDQFGITMGTLFQLTGEPVDKPWRE